MLNLQYVKEREILVTPPSRLGNRKRETRALPSPLYRYTLNENPRKRKELSNTSKYQFI